MFLNVLIWSVHHLSDIKPLFFLNFPSTSFQYFFENNTAQYLLGTSVRVPILRNIFISPHFCSQGMKLMSYNHGICFVKLSWRAGVYYSILQIICNFVLEVLYRLFFGDCSVQELQEVSSPYFGLFLLGRKQVCFLTFDRLVPPEHISRHFFPSPSPVFIQCFLLPHSFQYIPRFRQKSTHVCFYR